MEDPREAERPGLAEASRDRVQPRVPVEVGVLASVDQIEARDPGQDREGHQQDRQEVPGEIATHGDPGAERGEPQREPEDEVRCPGHALHEAVAEEHGQHGEREPPGQRRQGERPRHEDRGRERGEQGDRTRRQQPRGELTRCRSGIGGVDPAVDEAVEGHGRRAGRNGAHDHEGQHAGRGHPAGGEPRLVLAGRVGGDVERIGARALDPQFADRRQGAVIRRGLLDHRHDVASISNIAVVSGLP